MQDEGSSELLRSYLRRAGHQVRLLMASTIGTTAVFAGSYLAKKILETVPEPADEGTPPPATPQQAPADKSHPRTRRAA